jgi:hypothetical protein
MADGDAQPKPPDATAHSGVGVGVGVRVLLGYLLLPPKTIKVVEPPSSASAPTIKAPSPSPAPHRTARNDSWLAVAGTAGALAPGHRRRRMMGCLRLREPDARWTTDATVYTAQLGIMTNPPDLDEDPMRASRFKSSTAVRGRTRGHRF